MSKFFEFMKKHKRFELCDYSFKIIDDEHIKIKFAQTNCCLTVTPVSYRVKISEWMDENGLPDTIRFCSVCGAPMDAGYTDNEANFYACSEECFEETMNNYFGVEKWKPSDDLTEEDKEYIDTYFDYDCCYAYFENGEWKSDDSFYTEWY